MNYYFEAFKKYAEFNGKTSRKEFWMFVLITTIVSIILGIIDSALNLKYNGDQGLLSNIYYFATLVPSLAIGVRRMHDINKSGWWVLFPIVNIIMFTQSISTNQTAGITIQPENSKKDLWSYYGLILIAIQIFAMIILIIKSESEGGVGAGGLLLIASFFVLIIINLPLAISSLNSPNRLTLNIINSIILFPAIFFWLLMAGALG